MAIDIEDREIVTHFSEDEYNSIEDITNRHGFESMEDFIWYCVSQYFEENEIYFG